MVALVCAACAAAFCVSKTHACRQCKVEKGVKLRCKRCGLDLSLGTSFTVVTKCKDAANHDASVSFAIPGTGLSYKHSYTSNNPGASFSTEDWQLRGELGGRAQVGGACAEASAGAVASLGQRTLQPQVNAEIGLGSHGVKLGKSVTLGGLKSQKQNYVECTPASGLGFRWTENDRDSHNDTSSRRRGTGNASANPGKAGAETGAGAGAGTYAQEVREAFNTRSLDSNAGYPASGAGVFPGRSPWEQQHAQERFHNLDIGETVNRLNGLKHVPEREANRPARTDRLVSTPGSRKDDRRQQTFQRATTPFRQNMERDGCWQKTLSASRQLDQPPQMDSSAFPSRTETRRLDMRLRDWSPPRLSSFPVDRLDLGGQQRSFLPERWNSPSQMVSNPIAPSTMARFGDSPSQLENTNRMDRWAPAQQAFFSRPEGLMVPPEMRAAPPAFPNLFRSEASVRDWSPPRSHGSGGGGGGLSVSFGGTFDSDRGFRGGSVDFGGGGRRGGGGGVSIPCCVQ